MLSPLAIIIILIKVCEVIAITARRHTGPLPPTDWELGLREAVHQALLREHNTDPGLRDHLLEAPLIGRHDTATPFGDVAVLARGQLYATHHGYKLIQEPNDCEDCHHNRCERLECQPWKNIHLQKLLALWTVKRIRHRDPNYGYVFELEYTISPITAAINEELVLRGGFFNYNVPGHIFVIRSDPRLNSAYYLNNNAEKHVQLTADKWLRNQHRHPHPADQGYSVDKGSPGSYLKPDGILIGTTPDGYKQVLHSFPGFFSSYRPETTQAQTTIDPKEYELYKKLIESLNAKTTTAHRFALTTSTTTPKITTTTYIPIPETTFIRFTDNPYMQLPTTTTAKYRETTSPTRYPITPPRPITMPVTTIHFYAPEEEQTTHKITTKHSTVLPQTQHFDLFSENQPITTTSSASTKPVFTETRPITTTVRTKPISTTTKRRITTTTTRKPQTTSITTTQNFISEEVPVEPDLFEINPPTEPMKPEKSQPDSINEQLPPPDKETETTIPYVSSSTVTQPSTISTATSTKLETQPETEAPTTQIRTTTIRETTMPTTEKLAQTVTYTQFPITEPQTTIQFVPSTTYHDLTDSSYLATESENNEITTTQRKPTTIVEYSFGFTTTIDDIKQNITETSTTLETTDNIATTPQYYYTPDAPNSTTITYYTPMENIGETTQTTSTTTTKTTRKSTKITDPSDFLSDGSNDLATPDSKRDFNDDDIFGKAPTIATTQSTTTALALETTQSDLAQALFGGRRAKQIKVSSKLPEVTPKIIYSNFYTISPDEYQTDKATTFETTTLTPTTEFKPSTDQSYSTSISFEINKRKINEANIVQFEPTIMAKLSEVVNHKGDYKVYKAEFPSTDNSIGTTDSVNGATIEPKLETKKVLDNFALQLVNHARSIDYLNTKKTSSTSRKPKYKRRSYSHKTRRRSQRKNKDTVTVNKSE